MEKQIQIIEAPILIIAFNRPDISAKTFEYIRKAQPQKLYIAIDGHRPDKEGEINLVEQVKKVFENVDWPCETHYKYNDTNKGAELTVSSAISWVFEKEKYAIILEDDIVAPLSFLKFAQEMLIKYEDNERIGTVTGSNFTPIPVPDNTDYFFAKYGHSGGGWATWKRVWEGFDLYVDIPAEHLTLKYLKTVTNSINEAQYYQKVFKNLKEKGRGNSAWDYISLYFHRINERLSIIPRINLTSNIGTYGLHTRGQSEYHYRPFDEYFEVQKHPANVECFTQYDIHHFKNYIIGKSPLHKRTGKKLAKIFAIKLNSTNYE